LSSKNIPQFVEMGLQERTNLRINGSPRSKFNQDEIVILDWSKIVPNFLNSAVTYDKAESEVNPDAIDLGGANLIFRAVNSYDDDRIHRKR